MNKDKLKLAISESQRFIELAQKALDLHVVEISCFGTGHEYESSNGKANASCKRASLDLSNCLADLRKPR